MPTSPSSRRPSDFLGSNLETTDMDPDLMFSSASMGGYFQLPDWNASIMAVHEYEIETPYEDDPEAERLILRRAFAREDGRIFGDSWAGESTVAVCQREARDEIEPSRGLGKRKMSKVGETFAELGKAVKKRADSWSWWNDSVMATRQGRALRGRVEESSSRIVSPSSEERSRDGDDELSVRDDAIRRERVTRPWIRRGFGLRRKSTQTGLVSGGIVVPAQRRQTLPAPPPQPMLLPYDSDVAKEYEKIHFSRDNPQRRLAEMERGVRIAERDGAFDTAAIETSYKKPHRRLNSECRQQSQASAKLKIKTARAAAKSDKEFRRAQESRNNESPIAKVFNRIWRRNSRGTEVMVESDPASGLEDSSSGATGSAWSEDTADRLRTTSIQAVVHIGRAARLASVPF
jgi:hypothetical protein